MNQLFSWIPRLPDERDAKLYAAVGTLRPMSNPDLARYDSPPVSAVAITGGFWGRHRATIGDVTLEAIHDRLEETGRIDNFRVAAGDREGEFQGKYYNDSDVYKWVEATAHYLCTEEDAGLATRLEDVVDAILGAQEADGYLNTYFTLVEPDRKWTNLHGMHELYCAGHLIEAALAHHEATGSRRLLDAACRFADLIAGRFGPDGRTGIPGHEEIELALVALYRRTNESSYLELARYFIDARGQTPSPFAAELDRPEELAGDPYGYLDADGTYDGTYLQDHTPVRDQTTVEGHAVRATYLYAGMTDVLAATGDTSLLDPLRTLWRNMTTRRMYVTGGIGSSHEGERFTADFDLPNERAYAETCAAIGNVLWNHRLLGLTGEARYADVMERALYNGVLAGISLDGDRFFYANPLEVNGDHHALDELASDRFTVERRPWYSTACCPPNVARLFTALGSYAYLTRSEPPTVAVALYLDSTLETTVAGHALGLDQSTRYPWAGEIEIEITVDRPTAFTLQLRDPGWCERAAVAVNGAATEADRDEGFLGISRTWRDGDTVVLSLSVEPRLLAAHPAVRENVGRVAIQRGPLVYCIEGVDHDRPLYQYATRSGTFTAEHRPEVLDGVTVLTGEAAVPARDGWDEELYRSIEETMDEQRPLTAIPYYAWANREPEEMRVWIRDGREREPPSDGNCK